MLTLSRIEVEGFKSIRQLTLDLKSLNVLIGANGAGKSNFISLFGMLRHLIEGRLQFYVAQAGGADALLHFGRKRTPELKLRLEFGDSGYSYLARFAPSAADSLFFADEAYALQRTGSEQSMIPLGAGHPETQLGSQGLLDLVRSTLDLQNPKPEGGALRVLGHLMDWRVYHFHDTSASAKVKQTQDIGDNVQLRPDASNLAAFLFLLRTKHPESYQRIVATVRLVAPFFDDFRLRPNPLNGQKIQLEWSERNSDAYFNAHALSDGTLRFICLATLLLQPTLPSLVLIDEPELGLHPYAVQVLAGLVRSASQRTQVILSTQSVTLVNQLAPEDLVVVDRKEGASVFHHISEDDMKDWLDDYSLGELWEKNILGGRPG
jgi:predicted ATPase